MKSAFVSLILTTSAAAGPLTPVREWNADRAAHLLRRAGFGGTPEEVDRLAGMGVKAAVDSLVDFEKTPQPDADFRPASGLADVREAMRGSDNEERQELRKRLAGLHRVQVETMRAWWLRRMTVTPRPLEEKMTLFWHGHFTSGAREVENTTLLWEQNALLRRHALGKFRDLLIGISRDGAMLRYLDNISNKKRSPNENYARELLELFSMGSGYTESDVKEAARAFTGWTFGPDGFRVAERQHDGGVKKFLGRTGAFDGADIIDIVLEQEATSRFLGRKLLRFFVIEDPPDAWIRAVAYELRRTEFDLRATMRTLLRSEMFYDSRSMFSLIKSPVELVVGSMRLLEAPPDDAYWLASACRGMGQELFQPPNVKGWDGGRAWINTATQFERYNFSRAMLEGGEKRELRRRQRRMDQIETGMAEIQDHLDLDERPHFETRQLQTRVQPPAAIRKLAEGCGDQTAEGIVECFARRLLQRPIEPKQRGVLIEVLGGDFDLGAKGAESRVAELMNVIMAMPEYQLN